MSSANDNSESDEPKNSNIEEKIDINDSVDLDKTVVPTEIKEEDSLLNSIVEAVRRGDMNQVVSLALAHKNCNKGINNFVDEALSSALGDNSVFIKKTENINSVVSRENLNLSHSIRNTSTKCSNEPDVTLVEMDEISTVDSNYISNTIDSQLKNEQNENNSTIDSNSQCASQQSMSVQLPGIGNFLVQIPPNWKPGEPITLPLNVPLTNVSQSSVVNPITINMNNGQIMSNQMISLYNPSSINVTNTTVAKKMRAIAPKPSKPPYRQPLIAPKASTTTTNDSINPINDSGSVSSTQILLPNGPGRRKGCKGKKVGRKKNSQKTIKNPSYASSTHSIDSQETIQYNDINTYKNNKMNTYQNSYFVNSNHSSDYPRNNDNQNVCNIADQQDSGEKDLLSLAWEISNADLGNNDDFNNSYHLYDANAISAESFVSSEILDQILQNIQKDDVNEYSRDSSTNLDTRLNYSSSFSTTLPPCSTVLPNSSSSNATSNIELNNIEIPEVVNLNAEDMLSDLEKDEHSLLDTFVAQYGQHGDLSMSLTNVSGHESQPADVIINSQADINDKINATYQKPETVSSILETDELSEIAKNVEQSCCENDPKNKINNDLDTSSTNICVLPSSLNLIYSTASETNNSSLSDQLRNFIPVGVDGKINSETSIYITNSALKSRTLDDFGLFELYSEDEMSIRLKNPNSELNLFQRPLEDDNKYIEPILEDVSDASPIPSENESEEDDDDINLNAFKYSIKNSITKKLEVYEPKYFADIENKYSTFVTEFSNLDYFKDVEVKINSHQWHINGESVKLEDDFRKGIEEERHYENRDIKESKQNEIKCHFKNKIKFHVSSEESKNRISRLRKPPKKLAIYQSISLFDKEHSIDKIHPKDFHRYTRSKGKVTKSFDSFYDSLNKVKTGNNFESMPRNKKSFVQSEDKTKMKLEKCGKYGKSQQINKVSKSSLIDVRKSTLRSRKCQSQIEKSKHAKNKYMTASFKQVRNKFEQIEEYYEIFFDQIDFINIIDNPIVRALTTKVEIKNSFVLKQDPLNVEEFRKKSYRKINRNFRWLSDLKQSNDSNNMFSIEKNIEKLNIDNFIQPELVHVLITNAEKYIYKKSVILKNKLFESHIESLKSLIIDDLSDNDDIDSIDAPLVIVENVEPCTKLLNSNDQEDNENNVINKLETININNTEMSETNKNYNQIETNDHKPEENDCKCINDETVCELINVDDEFNNEHKLNKCETEDTNKLQENKDSSQDLIYLTLNIEENYIESDVKENEFISNFEDVDTDLDVENNSVSSDDNIDVEDNSLCKELIEDKIINQSNKISHFSKRYFGKRSSNYDKCIVKLRNSYKKKKFTSNEFENCYKKRIEQIKNTLNKTVDISIEKEDILQNTSEIQNLVKIKTRIKKKLKQIKTYRKLLKTIYIRSRNIKSQKCNIKGNNLYIEEKEDINSLTILEQSLQDYNIIDPRSENESIDIVKVSENFENYVDSNNVETFRRSYGSFSLKIKMQKDPDTPLTDELITHRKSFKKKKRKLKPLDIESVDDNSESEIQYPMKKRKCLKNKHAFQSEMEKFSSNQLHEYPPELTPESPNMSHEDTSQKMPIKIKLFKSSNGGFTNIKSSESVVFSLKPSDENNGHNSITPKMLQIGIDTTSKPCREAANVAKKKIFSTAKEDRRSQNATLSAIWNSRKPNLASKIPIDFNTTPNDRNRRRRGRPPKIRNAYNNDKNSSTSGTLKLKIKLSKDYNNCTSNDNYSSNGENSGRTSTNDSSILNSAVAGINGAPDVLCMESNNFINGISAQITQETIDFFEANDAELYFNPHRVDVEKIKNSYYTKKLNDLNLKSQYVVEYSNLTKSLIKEDNSNCTQSSISNASSNLSKNKEFNDQNTPNPEFIDHNTKETSSNSQEQEFNIPFNSQKSQDIPNSRSNVDFNFDQTLNSPKTSTDNLRADCDSWFYNQNMREEVFGNSNSQQYESYLATKDKNATSEHLQYKSKEADNSHKSRNPSNSSKAVNSSNTNRSFSLSDDSSHYQRNSMPSQLNIQSWHDEGNSHGTPLHPTAAAWMTYAQHQAAAAAYMDPQMKAYYNLALSQSMLGTNYCGNYGNSSNSENFYNSLHSQYLNSKDLNEKVTSNTSSNRNAADSMGSFMEAAQMSSWEQFYSAAAMAGYHHNASQSNVEDYAGRAGNMLQAHQMLSGYPNSMFNRDHFLEANKPPLAHQNQSETNSPIKQVTSNSPNVYPHVQMPYSHFNGTPVGFF